METLISPVPLLTIFLFVIAILGISYLCWRAQSLHFLLRRFWLLVYGSKDIPDPRIQAFTQEQTSLYAFRLFSGTQVQSLAQAHKLIEWSEAQQVPMATISACGDCFDLENHKVFTEKLYGKFYRTVIFLWFLILIMCICAGILIAISNPGLAFLKVTDRLVYLNESHVERVSVWPLITPALNRIDCQTRDSVRLQAVEFSIEEFEDICNLIKMKEWPEYVEKIKKDQRQDFLIFSLMCAVCLAISIPTIKQQYYARELHKKLTQPKEKENEYKKT